MADLTSAPPRLAPPKFTYAPLKRYDSPEGRTYGRDRVPSVTTILSATKDKTQLDAWAARVGPEEAERIKTQAAAVGTSMHSVIECLLMGHAMRPPSSYLAVKGYWMGYKLVESFFGNLEEVWGIEAQLLYPKKYAGTSDCIGVYKGKPSIIDFKQANRMKKRAWIEDYFLQLAAYAEAHNKQHGTDINQGVILMVAQDGEVQEFVTVGREFDSYRDAWWRRVEAHAKISPGDEPLG